MMPAATDIQTFRQFDPSSILTAVPIQSTKSAVNFNFKKHIPSLTTSYRIHCDSLHPRILVHSDIFRSLLTGVLAFSLSCSSSIYSSFMSTFRKYMSCLFLALMVPHCARIISKSFTMAFKALCDLICLSL